MTQRDERGRFTSRPVLHRQVENRAREIWWDGVCIKSNGSTAADPYGWREVAAKSSGVWVLFDGGRWERIEDAILSAPEHLQLDDIWQPEPPPARWPWVFFAAGLAVVGVMGLLLMGAR